MYHKKDSNNETSAYDRVLNAPENLDNSYNPIIPRVQKPVLEGKYKATRYTRVIPIVEYKEYGIQLV